ncbi:MAG: DUF3429 domain-containing protein, partial [Acetobacteraceae bacterium]
LGIVGLVPVIGCGLGAMGAGSDADRLLAILIAYCAVILSFLGGMQWGLALPGGTTPRVQRWRLILGVLPPLIGWVALMISLVLPDWIALALLTAGFIGVIVAEHRSVQRGIEMPRGYLWLRWGLSVVTIAMLVTVLTLRLLHLTVTV